VGLDYVHGYSAREGTRLADQATALTSLLHEGTRYPAGSVVLEADWASAIRDLGRAAETGGTFCYTFFKAAGLCPGR